MPAKTDPSRRGARQSAGAKEFFPPNDSRFQRLFDAIARVPYVICQGNSAPEKALLKDKMTGRVPEVGVHVCAFVLCRVIGARLWVGSQIARRRPTTLLCVCVCVCVCVWRWSTFKRCGALSSRN